VAFGSILFALSYAPTWEWKDPRIIILLVVGGIALLAWIARELTQEDPLLDLRVFKIGTFSLASIIWSIFIPASQVILFLLPLFVQNLRSMNAMQTGLLILPFSLGAMLAMPFSSILYNKLGPRTPILIGLFILVLTGIYLQNIDTITPDSTLMWVLFIRGVGNGVALTSLMTHALSSVSGKLSAQASTMISVLQMLSVSIIVAVMVTLMDGFQKTSLALMTQSITMDNPVVVGMLSQVQVMLMQAGQTFEVARSAGAMLLYQYCQLRSAVISFQNDFFIMNILSAIVILPALLLPRKAARHAGGTIAI